MKPHELREGREARTRFEAAIKKILNVPRSEIERREKQYQAQQALKPKRGPKRKPSAFRAHDSDD